MKSAKKGVSVESTDQIFKSTISPALNGMLSALVEPVPSDQIKSGQEAEEADIKAAIQKSAKTAQDVEDDKYLRVMSELSAQAEHFGIAGAMERLVSGLQRIEKSASAEYCLRV